MIKEEKVSQNKIVRKHSEETKQKISLGGKGLKRSEGTKQKIKAAKITMFCNADSSEYLTDDLLNLLLIEKTISEFGYDPTKLVRGSGRKIYIKCGICEEPKKVDFRDFIRNRGRIHNTCKGKKIKKL